MTVVDDLVTRYRLDDKDYQAGTKRVVAATHSAKSAVGSLGSAFHAVTGGLAVLGTAFVVTGAAVAGFSVAAMKAAAHFDTLERTFGAALGSMEAGKQTMLALEDYATRSAFSLEALSDAAKTLAAGGMSIGRFLPIVERFALVISGVDPQGLQQVAGALLRSKGGGFGEAMEIFRRAGVGAPDLRSQGIGVTKGGEVTATAEEFLNAIDRISQGRLKTIADNIMGGDENKMSNVGDVMGQAFRQIGANLNERFLPIVVKLTDKLKQLVDEGLFDAMADGFASLTGIMDEGGLVKNFETFAVLLAYVPRALKEFLEWVANNTGPAGKIIGAVLAKMFDDLGSPASLDLLKRGLGLKPRATGGGGFPEAVNGAVTDPAAELRMANDKLSQIADNTKRQVDLMRGALGGGDIGAMGVSQVDMRGMRSQGAGRNGARLIAIGMLQMGFDAGAANRSRRMAF